MAETGDRRRCPDNHHDAIVIDNNSEDEEKADWPSIRSAKRVCLRAPRFEDASGSVAMPSLPTTTRGGAAEAPTNETPPINPSLCESFQRAATERGELVSPPSPRPQKDLPLPTRLNKIIHKVTVHRSLAPIKTAADPPRTPLDVKAMICSSPVPACAGVARPSILSPSVAAPAKVFAAVVWPARLTYLHDLINSKSIKFPFIHHFGDCGCGYPCRIESCRNARMNLFCTNKCCVWVELCANRPRECSKVTVMQDPKTSQYELVATLRVEAGKVLGEYLGQLHCVPKKTSLRARKQGYMLRMRARLVLEEYVGIDYRQLGGRMRFTNHSCSINARLFEFANGCHHTVVVVTTQAISPRDEVTVNYRQYLWFVQVSLSQLRAPGHPSSGRPVEPV